MRVRPALLRAIDFGNPLSPEAYLRLRIIYWANLLEKVAPYLRGYLTHPDGGPYWWPINIECQHRNINIPIPCTMLSSWYGIFLRDLVHFCGLRTRALTSGARGGQKLLLGPWAHLFPYATPISGGTGEIDFGPNAIIELHEAHLRWFDYWLKGIDSGIAEEPPHLAICDGNQSLTGEVEWPLARTRYTPYYLHSQGAGKQALLATAA